MSTHNICFSGEIKKKYHIFLVKKVSILELWSYKKVIIGAFVGDVTSLCVAHYAVHIKPKVGHSFSLLR